MNKQDATLCGVIAAACAVTAALVIGIHVAAAELCRAGLVALC